MIGWFGRVLATLTMRHSMLWFFTSPSHLFCQPASNILGQSWGALSFVGNCIASDATCALPPDRELIDHCFNAFSSLYSLHHTSWLRRSLFGFSVLKHTRSQIYKMNSSQLRSLAPMAKVRCCMSCATEWH